jgi:hypothetical protein
MRTRPTKDPRIRLACHGAENWRTVVQDDPHSAWDITGPAYPTAAAALGRVDDVLTDYFGELPSRALLAARIDRALDLAREYGNIQGDAHRAWTLRRMVEELTGGHAWPMDQGRQP